MSEGIDVSSNNGTIDWKKVRASGVEWAYLKATEGVSYNDPTFQTYYSGAKAAGLKVGAYHFARPDNNTSVDEANHFIFAITGRSFELPPILDWEVAPGAQAAPWRSAWAKAFLAAVDVKTKGWSPLWNRPGIYVSSGFWNDLDPSFAIYNLWVAHWGVSKPTVPKPWTHYNWWQYSDSGTVPGVAGHVDRNRSGVPAIPQGPTPTPPTDHDLLVKVAGDVAAIRKKLGA